MLRRGRDEWNSWRKDKPKIQPNLSGLSDSEINLSGVNLSGINFAGANLSGVHLFKQDLDGADFNGADLADADLYIASLDEATFEGANLAQARLIDSILTDTNFSNAKLTGASLIRAHLQEAHFGGADLTGADLTGANLLQADFSGAKLTGADLTNTMLNDADFSNADLSNCRIFGTSAWRVNLTGSTQRNLIITNKCEADITVDNIEVGQFIHLLLTNSRIRGVIDTITAKTVLILGRFTPGRKNILDALRDALRTRDYVPILFDFDKPSQRDITETVSLLARMARFVVADLTEAKSVPQELSMIIPNLPSVPIQPLLLQGSSEYSMFEHFKRFPWVLETYHYSSLPQLIADLDALVIGPAEVRVAELRGNLIKD
jgi:uncharacterized protein YjbI with pentapeptide repeats